MSVTFRNLQNTGLVHDKWGWTRGVGAEHLRDDRQEVFLRRKSQGQNLLCQVVVGLTEHRNPLE